MKIKKQIKRISSTAFQVIPNGDAVRDHILKQGMKATEAFAYFWVTQLRLLKMLVKEP
jgi:hypothetical protein